MLDIKEEDRAAYRASADAMLHMIKKLHQAGVKILPGTDFIPGLTLHSELIVYAKAGISNADILKLATLHAAKIVGKDQETGSIEIGKNSDLVLIDGNPLENINNIRKTVLVIKGDRMYRPEELSKAVGVKPFAASITLQ